MRLLISGLALGLLASSSLAAVVGFDDLSLSASTFHNDGSFTSGGATFSNDYNATYGSFDGFAYSNVVNTTTAGYGNQYADITGGGHNGSSNYAIAYDPGSFAPPTITLPYTASVAGFYVTNTTYAFLALRDGNDGAGFVRQFGDNPATPGTGNEGFPDLFTLTITGLNASGVAVGSVIVPLADYTATQNSLDYVVDAWKYVDLSSLGSVKSLQFALASTDVGQFGINTPTYFAMDDLTYTPEPSALLAAAGLLMARRRR